MKQIINGNEGIVSTHILPTAPKLGKGVSFIKVASVEQTSLRCNIPHKQYDVIINGTHSYAKFQMYIPKYGMTNVMPDDWEYIQKRYGEHPSFKNGRIFAEKNEMETIAKAEDSEIQELATMTGTAQCTEKSLAGSNMVTNGDDGGVSDVTVKAS